jgi:TRAP-type C4-dicarboxylate transport system substrate-binding protein
MKGLKIRVQPNSDLWLAIISAMGAEPVPLQYNDIYAAIKAGTIDGAENNYPSYETTHHYEVAKYYSLTEHSMAPEILVFSQKVWLTLTPVQRQIIREAARESVPYMRKLWDEREEKSRGIVVHAGTKITEVDKVGFALAMKPVYEKFITDQNVRELFNRAQRTR